jgi:AcrR family transcriptional regulator
VSDIASTSRDKQREESRERLFHAAIEIFRRDGFRAARVDDITLVAGLSRTSFYFHFPTKDDVLLELNRRLEGPVVRRVLELSGRPLEPFIEEVTSAITAQWSDHRASAIDAVTVALRADTEGRNSAGAGSLRGALAKRFSEWMANGHLPDAHPSELLADTYLYNCFAALTAWGAGDGELKAVLRSAGALFLNGVLGASTSARRV